MPSGFVEDIKNSISETVSEKWEEIVENAGDLFMYIAQQLQEGANTFLQELINFVLYTPTVSGEPTIDAIWTIIQVIAFSLVGIMFVWEAFKKAISVDGVIRTIELRQMFTRMVYGLILAVFSLDLVDLMINFNNALVDGIRTNFMMVIDSQFSVNGVFSFVMVLALVIAQIVLGIKLILQYWMRIAEIWLMAVLGPLMYVLWINPNWGGYMNQWVRRLFTTIFTTFIWAILIALYSSMVSMVASAGMLIGFPTLGPIAGMCLSIALLLVMINTPTFFRSFMDSQPSALSMLGGTARKVVSSTRTMKGFAGKAVGWLKPKT